MVTSKMEVLFNRLLDMACIDTKEVWHWPGSTPFSLNEVLQEKAKGLDGAKEPYGDTWKYPVKKSRDKTYHIARIIYFMNNPCEINGIEVDNPCECNAILPECIIVDGWHRIAAGILLGLRTVDIEYGGRSDIENYISGENNKRPEEILVL